MSAETRALFPVVGCGKCADIVAAHLLTGQFYNAMAEHLCDHEPAPSIWGGVNKQIAEAA